ncbi:glycine-rich domain-containing protein [Aeromonas salmonicida]|uniref:glycine-rich domain-containing protein n=1 Tax=Aeromonas salmonicida TaxID=645 RepID=UPI000A0FACA7|nr:hypothetical protein [Aeromonas salmonicida]ORJ13795.1 hypothetical protein A7D02_21765 [Aeromonas salmonicida]ORJ15478.1 hypothetical protein A7D03_17260 [Aeromonas salmonicida]WCH32870.1 hypothetical protein ONZ67_07195 [Aeromonas salmonicida]WCH37080.1 hypothetical protein ONZ60_07260 [Aeromonas salmonicida]WGI37844.1 hypothetical protein QDU35_15855 [Aeromonas salmonicida]
MTPLGNGVALSGHRYPRLKQSIVLFDINPGTRQLTLEPGVYRVAVVGGGGGGRNSVVGPYYYYGGGGGGYDEATLTVTAETVYSYTVGQAGEPGANAGLPGGTSSFGAIVSATGGAGGTTGTATGGVGQAGTVRRRGGVGLDQAGGSAAHRFGDGLPGATGSGGQGGVGGGFSTQAKPYIAGRSYVDGWDIGLLPGEYGFGSSGSGAYYAILAGMGGGGCGAGNNPTVNAYVGGGAGGQGRGGVGAVIVERMG